jgi:hypothetical protein
MEVSYLMFSCSVALAEGFSTHLRYPDQQLNPKSGDLIYIEIEWLNPPQLPQKRILGTIAVVVYRNAEERRSIFSLNVVWYERRQPMVRMVYYTGSEPSGGR